MGSSDVSGSSISGVICNRMSDAKDAVERNLSVNEIFNVGQRSQGIFRETHAATESAEAASDRSIGDADASRMRENHFALQIVCIDLLHQFHGGGSQHFSVAEQLFAAAENPEKEGISNVGDETDQRSRIEVTVNGSVLQ
jgi:hypothetical protein